MNGQLNTVLAVLDYNFIINDKMLFKLKFQALSYSTWRSTEFYAFELKIHCWWICAFVDFLLTEEDIEVVHSSAWAIQVPFIDILCDRSFVINHPKNYPTKYLKED